MVKAIINDQPTHEVLKFASKRLKASREELFDALQGEITGSHRFVLDELMRHIEETEARIARFAYSTVIRPPSPRTFGHRFHSHSATDSAVIRPPIPV